MSACLLLCWKIFPLPTTPRLLTWLATAPWPRYRNCPERSGTAREPPWCVAEICRHFLTKRRKSHIISGSAGGVPERLKGADCKSVGLAPTLVRIQPPPPHFGPAGGRTSAQALGVR